MEKMELATMRFFNVEGVFMPTNEYLAGKVFYIWHNNKLHQAKFAYAKPHYTRKDELITCIGTKTYINIANVGTTLLQGGMRLYATKEDFNNGKLMSVSETLHKRCIRITEILYAIDGFFGIGGDSIIVREDNITTMYRYKFNEEKGIVQKVRPWLPLDLTISKSGYSFSTDLINEIVEFKKHTFASPEECLKARNVEVVCFDGEDEDESAENEENSITITAKGKIASAIAENVASIAERFGIEVYTD